MTDIQTIETIDGYEPVSEWFGLITQDTAQYCTVAPGNEHLLTSIQLLN